MVIGVPKEIKPEENRIAIVPGGVETLVHRGHRILIEKGAGLGSGFSDEEFIKAGAKITERHEDIFSEADIVLKVKEPLPEEYMLLRETDCSQVPDGSGWTSAPLANRNLVCRKVSRNHFSASLAEHNEAVYKYQVLNEKG